MMLFCRDVRYASPGTRPKIHFFTVPYNLDSNLYYMCVLSKSNATTGQGSTNTSLGNTYVSSYALSMSLSVRQPRLLSNFRPESPRTKKQIGSMMSSYRQVMRNYSNFLIWSNCCLDHQYDLVQYSLAPIFLLN